MPESANLGDVLLNQATNSEQPQTDVQTQQTTQAQTAPAVETQNVHTDIVFEDAPAEAKVETPAFDEGKWMTDNFGIADKTLAKQRLTEYDQLQTKYAEAELKLKEPKFKNQAAEMFDNMLSKFGGDLKGNAEQIKRSLDILTTDEAALQPIDAVRFDIKLQYPTMDDATINAYIAKKYSQTDLASDEDKAAGQAELMMDSQKAYTNIREMKAKLTSSENQTAQLQRVQAEKVMQSWQEPVKKVIDDFKEINLNLGKINGKNASMKFQIPAEAKAKYTDLVFNAMASQGQLPTAEAITNAQQTLRALYLMDNFDHITSHIASRLTSDQVKKEVQTYHNANGLGTQGSIEQAKKTQSDMIYEMLGGK